MSISTKKLGIIAILCALLVTGAITVKKKEIPQHTQLGTLIALNNESRDIKLVIYPDRIYIDPFESSQSQSNLQGIAITTKDYPNLFTEGIANESFISATALTKSGIDYIRISNNQPDHGGYLPTYSVFLNVSTGQITDSLEE